MKATEFKRRRSQLMKMMGKNTIAILPSASEIVRNRDAHFPFRQDSDFLYLTGFKEPDSVLVLVPGRKHGEFVLFCREKDPEQETWNGRRAGQEGAIEEFGADDSFPIDDIDDILPGMIEGTDAIYYTMGGFPEFDKRLIGWVNHIKAQSRAGVHVPSEFVSLDYILHDMRLYKSREELRLMRKAAAINIRAHKRAMQLCAPGMHEYHVQAALEYVFRAKGSVRNGYPSIVASGPNACVLHYIENDRKMTDGDLLLIDAGCEYGYFSADITRTFPVGGTFTKPQAAVYDVVLAAEQAALRECRPGSDLRTVHETAVRVVTEGLVDLGLIPTSVDDALEMHLYREFFMHGTSHWLGMDVHDCGSTRIEGKPRPLEAAMAFTVEPGIYINPDRPTVTYTLQAYDMDERFERRLRLGPAAKALEDEETSDSPTVDHEIPEEFLGIGIRIEDDVLVTDDGFENLSAGVPVEMDAIEALWRESSWVPSL